MLMLVLETRICFGTMAIELQIKHGDEAAEKRDFLGAISHYSQALKENPQAFLALLKRGATYTKLCNYDDAKSDLSKAFQVAESRGKRADMGAVYFRLALVYYAEKDYSAALVNFQRAKEHQCAEPALDIWLAKAERDIKKTATPLTEKGSIETASAAEPKSTSIEAINKAAPLKAKIRDDWYQSNEDVTVTIYAKGVREESFHIEFEPRRVAVSFPGGDNSEYNYNLDPLYGAIDVEQSRHKIYSTKVEITLHKATAGKWATLEGDGTTDSVPVAANSSGGLSYPTSSKKAVNWSSFKVDEEEQDDNPENFFAKLYKDVDDDTKRAMMKSYVESNGTVLTTNWSEAKDKQFETSPPEGMEAKKWS